MTCITNSLFKTTVYNNRPLNIQIKYNFKPVSIENIIEQQPKLYCYT